ncbi:MAG: Ig-like domain-containing protein [Fimbriimonadaceae bacterium]
MNFKQLTSVLALIGLGSLTLIGCAGSAAPAVAGTPLTVVATAPGAGNPSAPTAKRITATFSSPVDTATVTSTSFKASTPTGALSGTVSSTGSTATLLLTSSLPPNTVIVATVTTAIRDMTGRTLAKNFAWTFTTGNSGDVIAPVVSSTDPSNGSASVTLNKSVTAVFSEPMEAGTLNQSTFKVQSAGGSVAGIISLQDEIATFNPTNNFTPSTTYTATITTGAKDLSDNPMAADKIWTFTTGTNLDITPPTVDSTDPAAGATNVGVTRNVSATFSEAMSSATINSTTFTLATLGGNRLVGTVTYSNKVAVLNPTTPLLLGTTYVATISTGAKDTAGNPLANTKTWQFTTASTGDTTPPTVVSTVPTNNASNVSQNANLTATFSEAMQAATISTSTFRLQGPSGAIGGTVSYLIKVATFNPTSKLAPNATYTATVTTGVKDLSGNSMANTKSWTFKTATTGDVIPPTVIATKPLNNATNVFRNASVTATFSEAMQSSTLNSATFKISGVAGTVSYDNVSHMATFKPLADLAPNTLYTARIEVGASDTAGNGLAIAKVWSFTAGVQRSQTNINLGAASSYAVLAGSTVTNAGPSIINGNLGVSPGTAVTGFPPGVVNGAIHAGNSAAANAKAGLLAGQLEAAGRLGGATLPGNLSGLTITPGLYKNSTSVMLSAGNVTLDAQGDVNAVFIFQMGSTLTTSPGTQVILAGGAQAKNIYWSVGSSATLGVNSIFKGIILSEVSITVNTGAVVDGTLLTKIGAVTLQSNRVNK